MALPLDTPGDTLGASSEFTVVRGTMFVATITVPRHLRGRGLGSAELDRLCALAEPEATA